MNHAYFYRPRVPAEDLKNHKHIILQSFDEKFRDQLIGLGLDVERYGLPQVEGPPELVRGDVTITADMLKKWADPSYTIGGTWRNGSTFTLIEFYNKYHKNESNFLHDSQGNRLRATQGGRTFYLLRPKVAARQWWADVAAIMQRDGWNGPAFVDNVGLDASKIREVFKSAPAHEYAGGDQDALYQAEWAAFLDEGRLALGPGRKLGINAIGDWKAERDISQIASRADIFMLEAFAPWLGMRSGWDVDDDLRMLQRVQKLTGAGKQVICVCHLSSKDSLERRSYEYARYLLVHEPDYTSVRLVVDGDYGPITTVPEMDLELGKPLTYPVLQGRSWFRDFEYYRVDVFPETKTARFIKVDRTPQPDPPTDPRDAQIAELQQQVQGVLEREQQQQQMVEQLQKTVSELQTRLAAGVVVKF